MRLSLVSDLPSRRGERVGRKPKDRELKSLRTSWSRWTKIVELFARRRPARNHITRESYAALHMELIGKCRSLAESRGSGDPLYAELAEIVEPWISPQVLGRTDHDLLIFLLYRCRDLQRQLGIRTWIWSVSSLSFRVIVASLVVAALLLWSGTTEALFSTIVDWLRDWSTVAWVTIKWSTDLQRIFFLGVVLLIVSLIAVVRTARS
jgi:hypothetical protein